MKFLLAALLLFPTQLNREHLLDSWRESLELDFPGEVLRAHKSAFEDRDVRIDGRALALVARAHRVVGQEKEARRLLNNADPSDKTAYAVTLELARLDLADDNLTGAIERLTTPGKVGLPLTELREVNQAYFLLARAHARAGRLDIAAALLHTYLGRSPLEPEVSSAWHLLAREASARGDHPRAAEFRLRAQDTSSWYGYYNARRLQIRENPEAPLPRIGLAVLMLQANRPERARAALLDLFEVAPDHGPAYPWLSEAERKLSNFEAAYAANEKAIEHDPENLDHQINKGLLLRELKRPLEAVEQLELVLLTPAAENERYLSAHLSLARLYLEIGRESQAREQHERYRVLGGNEPLQ